MAGRKLLAFATSRRKRSVLMSSCLGGVIVPLALNVSRGHRGVAAHERESVF